MKRVVVGFIIVLLMLAAVVTTPGAVAQDEDDYESTIAAQETEIADLKGTVTARGEKINAQRTQIADLKAQLPVVNEDPAIGDVFAVRDFELTIQRTSTLEAVGNSFDTVDANGIFLVVYLDIRNVLDRPEMFPYSDFQVVDGRGRTYTFDSMAAVYFLFGEFEINEYEQLQPDLIYSTAVIFDVPEDATGFILTTTRGDFEAPLDL